MSVRGASKEERRKSFYLEHMNLKVKCLYRPAVTYKDMCEVLHSPSLIQIYAQHLCYNYLQGNNMLSPNINRLLQEILQKNVYASKHQLDFSITSERCYLNDVMLY